MQGHEEGWGLEPVPADIRRGEVASLSHTVQPHTLTFTPTGDFESPVSRPNVLVYRALEEAAEAAEKLQRSPERNVSVDMYFIR